MNVIKYFALSVAAISGFLMVIGFFRPWVALWWEPVQTRRKVIKLYGTVCVIAVILYGIIVYVS